MVNWQSKRLGGLLLLANGIVLVILLNMIASRFFFRVDLTEENRYSIKQPTKNILKQLEDDVHIEIYLTGDINPGFERFRKAIQETLDEFRIYSDNKVQYTFVDPSAAASQKAQSEFMAELASKGIQPTNVIDNRGGQRVEKIIFPGVLISYGGYETGVMLLKGNKSRTPDEEINQSIEGIEFELVNAINKLGNADRKHAGFVTGHGEPDSLALSAFRNMVREVYDVSGVDLNKKISGCDVLIIAKPASPFSPIEKYNLDQYVMSGGRAIMLLDKLEANMNSASTQNYFSFPVQLDLDDQLFRYGVRINPDLVQDKSSSMYPVVTSQRGGRPQMQLMEWPFFPLINHYAEHPITRNLDAVITRFTSSIDTVKAPGIKKTPLMFTSQFSRTLTAPVRISVNDMRQNKNDNEFTQRFIPVGYLLEGKFTSLFKNRFLPDGATQADFKDEGEPAKLIVIADGDLAVNSVNPRNFQPQELGFDPFTKYTFANRDLLLNALAYLTDENGLINARTKQVRIRPLNRERVKDEKIQWQLINVALPVLLVIGFGIVRSLLRKKRFARF